MSDSTTDQNLVDEAPDAELPDWAQVEDTAEIDASEEVGTTEQPSEESEAPVVEDTTEEEAAPLSTTDSSDGEDEAPPIPNDVPEGYVDEKRYKDLQAEFTRRNQAQKELERKMEELQSQMAQAQQAPEAPQVDPWHPSHPAHARFDQARQNYELFKEQMRHAKNDEERQVLGNVWQDKFEPDDLAVLKQWESHQQAQINRMAVDPLAFQQEAIEQAREIARQEAQALYRQQEDTVRYREFFSQPDVKPLAEKYKEPLLAMIQAGHKPEDAINHLRTIEQQNTLTIAEADRKVQSAEAQRKLARAEATTSRDRNGSGPVDPLAKAEALLKEQGIAASGQALWDALVATGED